VAGGVLSKGKGENMHRPFFLAVATFAAISGSICAQPRKADLRGGGSIDRGKCTIEVVVDGAVEIEIRGDTANMRNISGQRPQWRRFECTSAMPRNPVGFHFSGVDGRGRQELVRDPRNGGPAVVRIEDPQGGSEGYTFDLQWGGPGEGRGDRDRGESRRFTVDQAVGVCQEAVRQQAAERFRTRDIVFRRTALDDNPGRNDWVVGTFEARREPDRQETFRFSCSVNFDTGQVRSAEVEPMREPGRDERPPDRGRDGAPTPTSRAMDACQRAVEQRIRRDGYDRVDFGSINVDDRPGRNDWIIGTVRASGRDRSGSFNFSCSVDLRDGDVRTVDVRPR
jgi:hypothetical protein